MRIPLHAVVNARWRWWIPIGVMLLHAAAYAMAWQSYDVSALSAFMSKRQLAGTFIMFTLLQGYFLFVVGLVWLRTHDTLRGLGLDAENVLAQRLDFGWWHGFVLLLGFLFGGQQNTFLINDMLINGKLGALDATMVLGNCLVWLSVAFILVWRIPLSVHLAQIARTLPIDIYRLDRLKPLGRLAALDVLVVAGAMAHMPLQALDAQFRWQNYLAGGSVGIASAALLFMIPLWPLATNVMSHKRSRLSELRTVLDQTSRQDTTALETVSAHIHRVEHLPNWPIDIRLLSRILGYVVIPPLAWVAAALVENYIDAL